jgi:asparagine synthase (glutamine-hydrolysing)
MCGIAGASGKDSESKVKKMLETIKHRGPDGSGTISLGDITLGNVLLRITGDQRQPLSNRGALTYNGEIYNFCKIAGDLDISTDSDSEVLLQLIDKKGIEAAINEIDGDYAFAYAENEILYLARDTAGVKPLYYGYAGELFGFASEKKALLSIGINEIIALTPGHIVYVEKEKISQKQISTFTPREKITDEMTASKLLFDAIERAVKKRCYKPMAIAFSGGLDSSLIAAICHNSEFSEYLELYAVGMAGSHDMLQTKKAADLLGLGDKLHLQEPSIGDVEAVLPYVIKAIESTEPQKVSIALPLFFASRGANEDGLHVMLSGQGADELFAGYKRYGSMLPEQLVQALENDLFNIANNNLERDDAVTMANSVELRVPYLDRAVVELALGISPYLKIRNGIRKYILRKVATLILPEELVIKEKKAAQYSSGMYSALEKLAKKNGFRGERFVGKYMDSLT